MENQIKVRVETVGNGRTVSFYTIDKYDLKNLSVTVRPYKNGPYDRQLVLTLPKEEHALPFCKGQDSLVISTQDGKEWKTVKNVTLPTYNDLSGVILPNKDNFQDLKPIQTFESKPNPMKTMELVHYSDKAHGWVAVKRSLINELGIQDKISSCSYQSKAGSTIYLEEDGDALLLINALKEKGVQVKTVSKDTTVIRGYPRYQKA